MEETSCTTLSAIVICLRHHSLRAVSPRLGTRVLGLHKPERHCWRWHGSHVASSPLSFLPLLLLAAVDDPISALTEVVHRLAGIGLCVLRCLFVFCLPFRFPPPFIRCARAAWCLPRLPSSRPCSGGVLSPASWFPLLRLLALRLRFGHRLFLESWYRICSTLYCS